MALGFNRKKATDAVPDAAPDVAASTNTPAPASTPHPADLDAFDLEAFSAPATEIAASDSTSTSAFDFPETAPGDTLHTASGAGTSGAGTNDPLDFDQLFEIEQRNAATNAAATKNEAPAPFVPPSATSSDAATPFYAPQTPVATEPAPRKKLPLLPILGALAVLGLAGGAASLLTRGSNDEETAPLPGAPAVKRTANATTANATTANATTARGAAAVVPAPVVAPQLPTSADPVNPGIAPVSGTSAPALNPALVRASAATQLAQMKALWKLGAAAKKGGDYAGARRYWNQGLQIQPGNIGFQESIAKLPR